VVIKPNRASSSICIDLVAGQIDYQKQPFATLYVHVADSTGLEYTLQKIIIRSTRRAASIPSLAARRWRICFYSF
jgi:hypothetical protein